MSNFNNDVNEGFINSQNLFLNIGDFCLISLVLNKATDEKNHMVSTQGTVETSLLDRHAHSIAKGKHSQGVANQIASSVVEHHLVENKTRLQVL